MKVAVVGVGYVGLVTGTCLAEFGFEVVCIDNNKTKIDLLNAGKVPIYEPGLEALIKENSNKKRLQFTTDIRSAVSSADIVFIAVGTPNDPTNGSADMRYVYGVAKEIANHLSGYTIIVNKSTVPVGTVNKVTEIIHQHNSAADFDVVSNPEFLREGSAIEDFMKPDRVVIGCTSNRAKEVMKLLYRPLDSLGVPMVFTNPDTAELIKYASNAFLATKIAFINQIADMCEQCDADIQAISIGMGLDNRIGNKFLNAGPGYGGSCFPKDTLALLHTGKTLGVEQSIVQEVINYNTQRKKEMAYKVIKHCSGSVKGKKVAILGLTFKPDTNDMRDSPSLDIIPILQQQGAKITAFDPQGMEEAKKLMPEVEYADNSYDAMLGADALVFLTEWNEFRALNLAKVKQLLNHSTIIDLRNIYDPQEMHSQGISYYSIGR